LKWPGTHEVRLDDERQTAAHDAVAVLAAQARLHARHALIRHALHQADVKLDLVPLDDRALNLEEGKPDRRLPVLGRLRKAQAREGEPRRIGENGS